MKDKTGTGPVLDNLVHAVSLSGCLARTARIAPGGMVYHVINRGVGKNDLFFKDEDYLAFERGAVALYGLE